MPNASTAASYGGSRRIDDMIHRTVPTHSTGVFRFRKHLLGADRPPLIDGSPGGEEFQRAWSRDGLDQVDVWVRNVESHPDSFWLPRASGKFYPDFVARLKDGRVLVVDFKGAMPVGAPDEREKTMIGKLWARTSGNVFLAVEKMKHGLDPAEQIGPGSPIRRDE